MSRKSDAFVVQGLTAPVEILIDRWGVPHIYAQSERDLFIAQGFNAARDRLFQIDLWRRRGLGLLSEVFGSEYVENDRAARLFLYRGDMRSEWLAYSSDTKAVTSAFVEGINSYVELCRNSEEHLPPEFRQLGYLPSLWAPEDVARIRSHGLYYNVEQEVARAVTLRRFGQDVENLRRKREPAVDVSVPDGLDLSAIADEVLRVYRLGTTPPQLPGVAGSALAPGRMFLDGSNNWVVGSDRTATGRPLLANDPHRAVTLPSLRYVAHLTAPGIDVIGAGEPALPGISIGHNGRVAFGLTIFAIDQEDLYVYDTHAQDPLRYRYKDHWMPMEVVVESIPTASGGTEQVELRFTRHGPVIYEDPARHVAFAVRAAWLEPGMAPYLGSMEYMRARNAREFTVAMNRWGSPGENQIYADTEGTVGWRPGGLVPIRPNWNGTLPVPGDGRYEWAGFYDADQLPSVEDPSEGWFATANQMNLPPKFPNEERTISYDWYPKFRYERIAEVLSANDGVTIEDCVDLQTDYVSVPARKVLRILEGLESHEDPSLALALKLLRNWDGDESADSAAAALFEVWYRRHLRPSLLRRALRRAGVAEDEDLDDAVALITPVEDLAGDARIDVDLLTVAKQCLGDAPDEVIAETALSTLRDAVRDLRELLGDDESTWRWGALHVALLRHPLATTQPDNAPEWMTMGPLPRGGSGDTVGSAAYTPDFRQTGGSTFRIVVDVGAWDNSVFMNSPGQSGHPDDPHFGDLFEAWGADGSLPLIYSRSKIEANLERAIRLAPGD